MVWWFKLVPQVHLLLFVQYLKNLYVAPSVINMYL